MASHAREIHVAVIGDDAADGSAANPLRTIQAAAEKAMPGDVVTVREGIYRERIDPPRGGESEDRRIVYQAAAGESVTIKGSEVVKGWEKLAHERWRVVLPNSFFGDFMIKDNHVYRSRRYGIWLDWMSQGARVTGNLAHDNGEQDLFLEVNHGPHVVDNNIFLSQDVLKDESQGGAYAQNFFHGSFFIRPQSRRTPYHEAHSTKIVGLLDIPCGDNRFYNNLLGNPGELKKYDQLKAMTIEDNAGITDVSLVEKADGFHLKFTLPSDARGKPVTTERLGRTRVTKDVFENPDGSPIRIDRDYFGAKRNLDQPLRVKTASRSGRAGKPVDFFKSIQTENTS